jgi:hypothetical protein
MTGVNASLGLMIRTLSVARVCLQMGSRFDLVLSI